MRKFNKIRNLVGFELLELSHLLVVFLFPLIVVEALREIAIKLKKKDWNFNVDPCSGSGGWVNTTGLLISNVTCDCSFDNYTTCHVISL